MEQCQSDLCLTTILNFVLPVQRADTFQLFVYPDTNAVRSPKFARR